jgi:hypothetical protein
VAVLVGAVVRARELNSQISGKIVGISHVLTPKSAFYELIVQQNQTLAAKFPAHRNWEFFGGNQGKFSGVTGNSQAKQRIDPGPIFLTIRRDKLTATPRVGREQRELVLPCSSHLPPTTAMP